MTIEKKMEATQVAADPMTHMDLEIMNTLKQMYEEAKKKGYTGSQEQYMKTLSLDKLKRIGIKTGGTVGARS